MESIPDNMIDMLLAQPQKARSARNQLNLQAHDSRHLMIWVKLPHTFAMCANPDCPDDRPRKVAEGKAMCTEIAGKYICRICFLGGYGVLDSGPGVV